MKKKCIKLIGLALICFLKSSLLAQPKTIQPLKVGDKVPEYALTNIINYPTKTVKLSDFKGKLLLLDFWSTGCRSCIESWPKLLRIQREFEGKIQILLVNAWQSETVVRKTFETRKKLANVDMILPSMCGPDSTLLKLFHVSGVPHVVWIDEKGTVKSITSGGSINAENVTALLDKKDVKMVQKINNDQFIWPDDLSPLFINGNGGDAKEIYAVSFFGRGELRLRPGYFLFVMTNKSGIQCNASVKDLYRFAYSNRIDPVDFGYLHSLSNNRIDLQVSDTARYVSITDGEYDPRKMFAYQLIRPASTREQLQEEMQEDLKKYFGLNVSWVKRKKKCLVLSARDTSLVQYKDGEKATLYFDTLAINKIPVSKFVLDLETKLTTYYESPYPIIDETNFKGLLGLISAKVNTEDYRALDRVLQKFGMRLTLQDREVNVLLISEPPGYKFPYVDQLSSNN